MSPGNGKGSQWYNQRKIEEEAMIYVVYGVVVALVTFVIIDEIYHVIRLQSLRKWFDEERQKEGR